MMRSLQEIYSGVKSDKGTIHSYITYYEKTLTPYRDTNNTVLEIGIFKGGSILMWREYFSNAKIIGFDIKDYGAPIGNYELIYKDATVEDSFNNLSNIDIVIDDGSHTIDSQIKTFKLLFPKLNPNGLYIIEDIVDIDNTKEKFLALSKNVKIHDFRHLKNRTDDVIVEVRK